MAITTKGNESSHSFNFEFHTAIVINNGLNHFASQDLDWFRQILATWWFPVHRINLLKTSFHFVTPCSVEMPFDFPEELAARLCVTYQPGSWVTFPVSRFVKENFPSDEGLLVNQPCTPAHVNSSWPLLGIPNTSTFKSNFPSQPPANLSKKVRYKTYFKTKK